MAQESAERLQHFQTVVALASELDLAVLHPPMASSSPTPLSTVSSWDSERLRRVSRWRPSEDPGKDLVRAYCKVVLALEELDSCSQRISLHAGAGAVPSPVSVVKLPPQSASGGVVLKSAVKSRQTNPDTGARARAGLLRKSQWATGKLGSFAFPAPPPCLYDIASAWFTAFQYMAGFFVFCLTWAPWVCLLAGGILVLAEPSLVFKLFFKFVGFVPSVLLEYVRFLTQPNLSAEERPVFASGAPLSLPIPQPAVSQQPDPALVGHCTVPAVVDTSAVWLAAGQGGAVSALVLLQRYGWIGGA